jgi:putative transposase
MPRQRRQIEDNAIYHIISRGHNKAKLFEAPKDFGLFKSLVREYSRRFGCEIFHYCLMPNHIHLLLRAGSAGDFPKFMQGLFQSYSFYVRRNYDRVGYIFQGRYKNMRIDNDIYLLDCGRYIERNPVRAAIVRDPSQYKWSSYNFYINGRPDDLVTVDPMYLTLADDENDRRKIYSQYLNIPRDYEMLLDNSLKISNVVDRPRS